MDITEFSQKIGELFDETAGTAFEPQTKFQEHAEWGSLTMMMMLAFLSTEMGKNLNPDQVRSCKTVHELYEIATAS